VIVGKLSISLYSLYSPIYSPVGVEYFTLRVLYCRIVHFIYPKTYCLRYCAVCLCKVNFTILSINIRSFVYKSFAETYQLSLNFFSEFSKCKLWIHVRFFISMFCLFWNWMLLMFILQYQFYLNHIFCPFLIKMLQIQLKSSLFINISKHFHYEQNLISTFKFTKSVCVLL